MNFDIAIIGGGPAGYNAGEHASANGLQTVLFEKNNIGGVCLNEGCIPTKALLYSAKIFDNAKSASKYGIVLNAEPSFDFDKIMKRKNKVVKKLVAGIKQKLSNGGVTVVNEFATLLGEDDGQIRIKAGDTEYKAKKVLLCTGSETIIPPIKGLGETNFWTSKEALDADTLPKSIVIIGGGVIGVEFASFFNSMGVNVTVVEMLPEILGAMDKETSAMLRAEYTKKGVKFVLSTKVVEVTNSSVTIEKGGQTEVLETEKVLLSVGRKAITDNLGLDSLQIELVRGAVKVNETMQTSHPNVYASGDITGFSMLAHTAIREGEVAINNILGKKDVMRYNAIPGVVYTNPEIAGVGATEEELTAKGIPHTVLKLPLAFSGRFVAENELGNGLCKIIVDDAEHIIGCHIIGNPASELIVTAGIAIENGETVESFRKHVYPHPTVGEIFHEVLYS